MSEFMTALIAGLAGGGAFSILGYLLIPKLLTAKLKREDAETNSIQYKALSDLVLMTTQGLSSVTQNLATVTALVNTNAVNYLASLDKGVGERKTLEARIDALEKANEEYRTEIAGLKATVATLETLLKQAKE